MIRRLIPFVASLLLSTGALAATTDDDTEGVSGGKPPVMKLEPKFGNVKNYEEYKNREFPPLAYVGANMLNMEPKFVNGIQTGLDKLYIRDYNGARDHFDALEKDFPNTGLAAVADTLVWQALMLENFDFRWDKQYFASSKQAKNDIEAALTKPGNEAWEHLVMASIVGMESIHTMRKSKYLSALQMAFEAMDHITKSREAAPDFVDLNLADGMYNYWRTVITLNSKVLPNFGDKRVEGLEQIGSVETAGAFVRPLATLALAFSWIEEGEMKRALGSVSKLRRLYPNNIVNNMVTGEVFIYLRKYASAVKVHDEILKVDPKNRRVHYWRGLALLRSGKLDEAKSEFETYSGFDSLEKYQQSYTHYRLGQVYNRQKNYKAAFDQYKKAVKLDGHKAAKSNLERLQRRKKEGKIDY